MNIRQNYFFNSDFLQETNQSGLLMEVLGSYSFLILSLRIYLVSCFSPLLLPVPEACFAQLEVLSCSLPQNSSSVS